LVGRQEEHSARKKYGGMVEVALVSPDGVVPSRMVSVFASVNLSLHHEVQKFSSATGSPRWSRKKGHKTVVVWYYTVNQATGYASQHIWCLSQARINWEGCGKKDIQRKNGG